MTRRSWVTSWLVKIAPASVKRCWSEGWPVTRTCLSTPPLGQDTHTRAYRTNDLAASHGLSSQTLYLLVFHQL